MSQRLRIYGLADIFGKDSGDEDDEDQQDDTNEDEDEVEESEDENSDDDTVESLREQLAEATKERERAHRRMRQADRAKSKVDKELADLKKGGQSELAEARDEIERLKTQLAEINGKDTRSLVREEFRDNELVRWHDPKLAFSLLDLDEIEVEDGKVDGASLKDAIENLAKTRPYLVKSTKGDPSKTSGDEDGSDSDAVNDSQQRRSGTTPATRRNKQNKRNAELAARYGISGRI